MKKISYFLLALSLAGSYAQGSELKIDVFKNNHYLIFKPKNLQQLQLGWADQQGKVLGSFRRWQQALGKCTKLEFAMNAGMYHPNYYPVGLYIEKGQQRSAINTDQGSGNFFLQPNGVVAWNTEEAVILPTMTWLKTPFSAHYATQSGPMLVLHGKVLDLFIPNSDSKKIRNGVGIKNGELYFVISQQPVNFYQFAEFFQQKLGVQHALYLDGSISSVYAPKLQRYDRAFKLGPMLGYVQHQSQC